MASRPRRRLALLRDRAAPVRLFALVRPRRAGVNRRRHRCHLGRAECTARHLTALVDWTLQLDSSPMTRVMNSASRLLPLRRVAVVSDAQGNGCCRICDVGRGEGQHDGTDNRWPAVRRQPAADLASRRCEREDQWSGRRAASTVVPSRPVLVISGSLSRGSSPWDVSSSTPEETPPSAPVPPLPPSHPQTCGKVERFRNPDKRLAAQFAAASIDKSPYDNALMGCVIGLFKTEAIATAVFHNGPYKTSPTSSTRPPAGSTGSTTDACTAHWECSPHTSTNRPTTLLCNRTSRPRKKRHGTRDGSPANCCAT